MRNDPYWLTAKFGKCSKCGADLKGKRAFFFPIGKKIFGEKCCDQAEKESGSFGAACFDEGNY
jgi:hypothetical protein